MKTKPLIYLASPFSKGDQFINLRAHIDMFNLLLDAGLVTPIAPLMVATAHFIQPRSYQDWIAYDLEILARCDALFAFDAHVGSYVECISPGRGIEKNFAKDRGIPVFTNYTDLMEWVAK